jgi:hypothetical protein
LIQIKARACRLVLLAGMQPYQAIDYDALADECLRWAGESKSIEAEGLRAVALQYLRMAAAVRNAAVEEWRADLLLT